MDFSFEHMRAVRFMTPPGASTRIVLVGTGGTGSWLAPALARICAQSDATLMFMDPDVVEEGNCQRQNFCFAEIGRNKAVTLARRYGAAWGIDIAALPEAIGFDLDKRFDAQREVVTLWVGCVDNAAARRALEQRLPDRVPGVHDRRVYWLDCGNTSQDLRGNMGQVVLGSTRALPGLDAAFGVPTWCTALPCTTLLQPNLREDVETARQHLSCEEQALANVQGLTINQLVASVAAEYVARFVSGSLRTFATYLDTGAMSMRSLPNTPASVAAALPGLTPARRANLVKRMTNAPGKPGLANGLSF